MKGQVRILLVVVLCSMGILMLPAIPAVARDYGPLDGWDRTAPYSTYQHWEFTADPPLFPEEFHNPFGEPPLATPDEGEWGWSDDWPCPPGIEDTPGTGTCAGWHCSDPGGGKFLILIPNNPEPNLYKRIFLQITSSKAPSGVSVTGQGGAGGYTSGTFPTGRPPSQEGGPPPFPGSSWYTYNYGLIVQPNPEYEEITIEVPYCTVIDQIVVDTECIPEPATMALLILGGIGLIFRRKKRM